MGPEILSNIGGWGLEGGFWGHMHTPIQYWIDICLLCTSLSALTSAAFLRLVPPWGPKTFPQTTSRRTQRRRQGFGSLTDVPDLIGLNLEGGHLIQDLPHLR